MLPPHLAAGSGTFNPNLFNMRGVLAAAPDDIPRAMDCLWGIEDLSQDAAVVVTYLAETACPVNGEAVVRVPDACARLDLTPARFIDAVNEALSARAIRECVVSNAEKGSLIAFFEVDDDIYYGDDTNAPADWERPVFWGQAVEFDYPDNVPISAEEWEAIRREHIAVEYESRRAAERCPKRARIFEKTEFRCFYCVDAWVEHVDHMHPRARGGSDDESNLIGACRTCNVRKKDRTVEEYRYYLSHREKVREGYVVAFYGENGRKQ